MNRTVSKLALVKLFILLVVSCGRTPASKAPAPVAPEPPHAFIERLASSDEPVRLCDQVLTSEETIAGLRIPGDTSFVKEDWPVKAAFFEPEPDILVDDEVKSLKNRCNLLVVNQLINHAYELYDRQTFYSFLHEIPTSEHKGYIAEDAPKVPYPVLRSAIEDSRTCASAAKVLSLFKRLDGGQKSLDRLNKAMMEFGAHLEDFPELASADLMEEFRSRFWDWYSKDAHVESIGKLIRIAHPESGDQLSEREIDLLRHAVECERDIDRRAILAIEYSKFADASLLLGEIIESGIYTKYLFEVWLVWRTAVQVNWMGMSSDSLIPDMYYSTLRCKCINTYLRHLQTDPDPFDRCLIENMLVTENLHRLDGLFGNEATSYQYYLRRSMFIDTEKYGINTSDSVGE